MKFKIENVIVPLKDVKKTTDNLDENLDYFIRRHCKISEEDLRSYEVIHKSVDARKKSNIKIIYKLVVDISPHLRLDNGVEWKVEPKLYENIANSAENIERPIIVGMGPAGLMTGYLLAKAGLKPLIIEQGSDVDNRKLDIDKFFQTRELNEKSNFLCGEGGAGTFSDGKLYTRKRDSRINFILDFLIENGAPKEIKYLSHPHIGSDILPNVIKNIRKKIIEFGGEVKWNTTVKTIIKKDDECIGVISDTDEKFLGNGVFIACGHSSRVLIKTLINENINYVLKDFQIGCRIEHKQTFINKVRYGIPGPPKHLTPAEYNIVSRAKNIDDEDVSNVTSFCMCPGGEIVPCVNENGTLSTNGMSNYERSAEYANSALIVNQDSSQFENAKLAFEFLEKIEKKLFETGGKDFTCPAQNAYSFLVEEDINTGQRSSYKLGIKNTRLDELLSENTKRSIQYALQHFENMMPGFVQSGMLIGIETHISSPIRFLRDKETLQSSLKNLYILGEGAGYASGIMSSAIDGLKITENFLNILEKH